MPTVLAVTRRAEMEAFPLLADALAQRGARVVRLDSETFPTGAELDAELGADGHYRGALTTAEGERVDLGDLHAVWMHRLGVGAELPREGLDRRVRRACQDEAEQSLLGVLTSLSAPMVNDWFAASRCENKAWQLARARRCGLVLPDTLLSNSPEGVRAFARRQPALITKMLSTHFLPKGGDRGLGRMPTSAVGEDDLAALDGALALAPAAFQRRVDKTLEVRAVTVGGRIFAAGTDTRRAAGGEVDWRQASAELMERFEPVELPEELSAKLVRLHALLGLDYGGADLILDPELGWVFLETNPGGRWPWLQRIGLDIAGPLADTLLTAGARPAPSEAP